MIEHTREEILLAAARLLARSGHKPVSLADIAAEMGLTAPALYAYFESKQAIFAALVALVEREVAALFAGRASRGAGLRARVGGLLRRQLELADRRRDVFLAIFSLHVAGEAGSKGRPPAAFFGDLVAWFKREVKPSDVPACTVEEAAWAYHGMAHAFFLRWLLAGSTTPLVDETDRILDLFLHGVAGSR